VHRDISPGNILLDKDGETVILSDLEYAKSLADDRSHEIRTVTFFRLESLRCNNALVIGDC
jgi:serine/threonine protein kinase